MLYSDSSSSRWSYIVSDVRSEPFQPSSSARQMAPCVPALQQTSPPPPPSPHPIAVEREPGVWEQDDDVLYSAEWAPVQEYLGQLRTSRRLISAPSEVIYTLAALSVLQTPEDALHWLFWGPKSINSSAPVVNRIALHKPRLIKSHVPWIGEREYRAIILSRQEKFQYVFLGNQWYPTSSSPNHTRKRALRSSGDRMDQDINDFFNLIDDGEPPTKRARKARKETQSAPAIVRPKRVIQNRDAAAASTSGSRPQHDRVEKSSSGTISTPSSPPPGSPDPTPITSSPRAEDDATPQLLPSQPESNSTHARTRSISQDSSDTLVDEDPQPPHHRRSSSVSSAETTVGVLSSKKRKLDDLKDDDESNNEADAPSKESEGMVTRGRASKAQKRGPQPSETLSSRTPTPAIEMPTRPARTRTKSRKIRG